MEVASRSSQIELVNILLDWTARTEKVLSSARRALRENRLPRGIALTSSAISSVEGIECSGMLERGQEVLDARLLIKAALYEALKKQIYAFGITGLHQFILSQYQNLQAASAAYLINHAKRRLKMMRNTLDAVRVRLKMRIDAILIVHPGDAHESKNPKCHCSRQKT